MGGRSNGSTFGTRAIVFWLRLFAPGCLNPHQTFHIHIGNFILDSHLTYME
jgi:hypothetical protein